METSPPTPPGLIQMSRPNNPSLKSVVFESSVTPYFSILPSKIKILPPKISNMGRKLNP